MKRLALAVAAVLVVAAAATPAQAATRTITIGSAFTPSLLVVPPGTTLIWKNNDSKPHSFTGDVNSAALQPGASTSPRVLNRVGQYHYSLDDNSAVRGTVVVARRARKPAPAGGSASRRFRGSLVLRVNEKYRFYDGDWRSTSGACNAEVGSGSRTVVMRARLNNVRYFRGAGHESLSQRRAAVTWVRYAELVNGRTSTSASREVTCQDGTSTDQTADQSVDCFRDHAGARAHALFAWTPNTTGRFELVVRRSTGFARCGTSYAGILQVLGAPAFSLPVNLVDRNFTYTGIATTPSSVRETRAIRAGHRLRVVRRMNLAFTTGCCDGYQPQGEADTRIGTIHTVTVTLTLTLRPRS